MPNLDINQLATNEFGLSASGYVGSQGPTGYLGSAGVNGVAGADGSGSNSPKITNIQVTDSGYTAIDDTAVGTAGGYIKITGSGFASGCNVLINQTTATSVTFVSSTEVRAQIPAMSAGGYIVYVVNTDGRTGISVTGVQYSGTPAWTTAAGSLGSAGTASSFTANLAATGDAPITYSVYNSSLPNGLTLNGNTGVISGTAPAVSSETTYNFTIRATDAQQQETDRNFSITVTAYGAYLATDLFMHYDFSNPSCYSGSGTSVVDLQGTRNGTITGATYGGTGLAKYLDFEADSTNYVAFGSNIPTGQSTSALSIEAWIYTESLAGTYMSEGIGAVLSSQQDSGYNGASLNTDTRSAHGGGPNGWHPQIGNGSSWASNNNYNTPSGTASVSNRWDHIVMTWSNGNSLDVYKNGNKISTSTAGWSATISWSNCYWSLGQQQCNTASPSKRAYDGKIAIVRIYNRGLNSSEITSNYNGQKSRFGL